jgi:hypothetical protein
MVVRGRIEPAPDVALYPPLAAARIEPGEFVARDADRLASRRDPEELFGSCATHAVDPQLDDLVVARHGPLAHRSPNWHSTAPLRWKSRKRHFGIQEHVSPRRGVTTAWRRAVAARCPVMRTPISSFVGRTRELAELDERLARARL